MASSYAIRDFDYCTYRHGSASKVCNPENSRGAAVLCIVDVIRTKVALYYRYAIAGT
jgi:hypothetical protein